MSKVMLEETENRRRLHIGSYFTDLNESEYRDLVKIFSRQEVESRETRISQLMDSAKLQTEFIDELEARIAELEAGLKGLLIHNPKDNWEDYTQKWDAAKQLLNPTNDKR